MFVCKTVVDILEIISLARGIYHFTMLNVK